MQSDELLYHFSQVNYDTFERRNKNSLTSLHDTD